MAENQMDRDSLGSLTIPSESSGKLATSMPPALAAKVGDPIGPRELAAEMARLNATFGLPKDRTAEQVRIMANEWHKALQGFGIKSLRYAVDNLIRNSKWWPALSEVYALCKADHDGWKDALLIDREPSYKASDDGWVKPPPVTPPTEAEKAAKRAADVLTARAKYKDFFKSQSLTDRIDEWAPASKSPVVSDALRAAAIKGGYWRGPVNEETA